MYTIKATEFYAVKSDSKVAHIVIKHHSHARCGRYIMSTDRRASEQPRNTRICKQCEAQRQQVSADRQKGIGRLTKSKRRAEIKYLLEADARPWGLIPDNKRRLASLMEEDWEAALRVIDAMNKHRKDVKYPPYLVRCLNAYNKSK